MSTRLGLIALTSLFAVGFSACSNSGNVAGSVAPLTPGQKGQVQDLATKTNASMDAPLYAQGVQPQHMPGTSIDSRVDVTAEATISQDQRRQILTQALDQNQGKCQFTHWPDYSNQNPPSDAIHLFQPTGFKVEGSGCPITMDDEFTPHFDQASSKGSFAFMTKYSVQDPNFQSIADVDAVELNFTVNIDGMSGQGSGSGRIHSQTYGEVKLALSVQGDQDSSTMILDYTFPTFMTELKMVKTKNATQYYVNGQEVSKDEFDSYSFNKAMNNGASTSTSQSSSTSSGSGNVPPTAPPASLPTSGVIAHCTLSLSRGPKTSFDVPATLTQPMMVLVDSVATVDLTWVDTAQNVTGTFTFEGQSYGLTFNASTPQTLNYEGDGDSAQISCSPTNR